MEEYNKWNSVKKELSKVSGPVFEERQVWWTSIGYNLGDESFGKNQLFERPVLILKKLSSRAFIGVPITTTESKGSYFYTFEYFDDLDVSRKVYLMLHQARIFSCKRLIRKLTKINDNDFAEVRLRYGRLFNIEKPAFTGFSPVPNGKDIYSIPTAQNLSTLSQTKQKQAGDILKQSGIVEILSKFGQVRVGGSFYTNLMTNNDIDIVVVSEEKYNRDKSSDKFKLSSYEIYKKYIE